MQATPACLQPLRSRSHGAPDRDGADEAFFQRAGEDRAGQPAGLLRSRARAPSLAPRGGTHTAPLADDAGRPCLTTRGVQENDSRKRGWAVRLCRCTSGSRGGHRGSRRRPCHTLSCCPPLPDGRWTRNRSRPCANSAAGPARMCRGLVGPPKRGLCLILWGVLCHSRAVIKLGLVSKMSHLAQKHAHRQIG